MEKTLKRILHFVEKKFKMNWSEIKKNIVRKMPWRKKSKDNRLKNVKKYFGKKRIEMNRSIFQKLPYILANGYVGRWIPRTCPCTVYTAHGVND